MHRLDHILSFDKVAVFANGELVEFDEPSHLLQQVTSRFTELYNASKTEQRRPAERGIAS